MRLFVEPIKISRSPSLSRSCTAGDPANGTSNSMGISVYGDPSMRKIRSSIPFTAEMISGVPSLSMSANAGAPTISLPTSIGQPGSACPSEFTPYSFPSSDPKKIAIPAFVSTIPGDVLMSSPVTIVNRKDPSEFRAYRLLSRLPARMIISPFTSTTAGAVRKSFPALKGNPSATCPLS